MTDHTLHVSIVTPRRTAFEGAALAVSVPGSQSPFQVLFNHTPIISSLDVGIVKIEEPSHSVRFFAAKEGFVEVLKNNVSIVVQELLAAEDVDIALAETDYASAKSRADTGSDRVARELARKEAHWAETRIKAARMLKEVR